VAEQLPVFERTLPNGLRLLLREDHGAPIASFWTWYRVGSRDEPPGLTGASHWVEHMQFKGTPSLAKGQVFRDVSRQGGTLNALTSHDWTAYYETLPVDRLDLALRIESDRMQNSLFDPEETEAERTVILSERQGARNNPTYLLYEAVVGAAFRAHPYRHMVIGHESDLRGMTRDDLYDHYRRYYQPANAFVVAVGDFDARELADRIEAAFGGLVRGEPPPSLRVAEPEPLGERRITLRRPAPTPYLRVAFGAPGAQDPDLVPLLVADAVLSGGKALGLGGGGPMGRSSRLYRSLVASGLARAAGSDVGLTVDPYLMVVGVTALPDTEPERIEAVVDDELARLRDEPVPAEELARALKQVRAQYVYSAEGVTNQAFWLGQMEIVDRHERADELVDELERVTAADLQRVARRYLDPAVRTIGWLLPTRTDDAGGGEGSSEDATTPTAAPWLRRRFWTDGSFAAPSVAARPPFERAVLPSGLVVLGQARQTEPSVVVHVRLQAGATRDPDGRLGLATFTARMLLRGTASRSFAELNETTDSLGATLSIDAGRHYVELTIRCLREDLPTLLHVASDVLREPTFPEEEVEKVRNELLSGIREADNDTRATADRLLRVLLYPAPHPYGRRVLGEATSVADISRDELVAFHAANYGPAVATVAVVGGVAGFGDAVALLGSRFADWKTGATPPPSAPVPALPDPGLRSETTIAGKSQADLAIGFPTLSRLDPAYDAFDTANLVLGRLGLMGRLGASVRDRQGLAYYAFSQVEPDRIASSWVARAGVGPDDVERAIESVVAEVRRLAAEPVAEEELTDAKSYLTGVLPLALESNGGTAATLLAIEQYDLGLDYLERYPVSVTALTADELLAAVRAHLDPDRLAIAVALPR
jgi:zinc protease